MQKSRPYYPPANSGDPDSFQSGLEYQDFIATQLHKHLGITINNYQSRAFQFDAGENLQGIEIKLDRWIETSERLSIEIAEKTRASNPQFVASGIYRNDNSWLYIQGTWHIIFVFAKAILQLMHKSKQYTEHIEPTLKGFYVPVLKAKQVAACVLELDKQGNLLTKTIGDKQLFSKVLAKPISN
jgi:hypothetical protein